MPTKPRSNSPAEASTEAPGNPCGAASAEAFSFGGHLTSTELERVNQIVALRHFDVRQLIVIQSDIASHRFILNEGCVKVYRMLADGRVQVTGFLFPPDFFGVAAGGRYAYNAEAVIPSSVCAFPAKDLERIMEEFPEMERRLLSVISNEIAAAQDQMLLLGRKTALERTASFIQGMANRSRSGGDGGSRVFLPMNRSDIADYLGLTTETVSRAISNLKARGVIELSKDRRTISITDGAALSDLAEDSGQ